VDGAELGRALRARRKAAGRTIASVAMDAGLSVPYIANLENGRGNPTLSALERLAAALGARLDVGLADEGDGDGGGGGAIAPGVPDTVRRLMESPRVLAVTGRLAKAGPDDVLVVRERVQHVVLALAMTVGGEVTERDVDRLLDLLLLSRTSERGM
jgi:transcriptional regulator with XRE-family HTH domain